MADQGNPAELKDGVYEVRVVAVPKAPGQDFGVLVLKEEGKAPKHPLKYYQIPAGLFVAVAKIPKVGDELTIEIRPIKSPAHRELVIK